MFRRFETRVTATVEVILLAVVVTGILVRIVGVATYVSDSGDEWGNLIAPFRILYQWGDPESFHHPSLYYYVTAAVYALVFALLKVLGIVPWAASLADVFLLDARYFVYAARGVSAVSAALTMWVLYGLGKSLWGRQGGLACAALLAVSPLHALYSEEVRVDSLFVLVFIYAFARIVRILDGPAPSSCARTGFFTGLASGANYNGGVLVPWLIAAHYLRVGSRGETHPERLAERRSMRPLGKALAFVAAGFLISSPFVVLDIKTFLRNFTFISELSVSAHPGWEGRDGLFYARELMQANPRLAVLLVVSSVAVLVFGNRSERFILSLPVGYLLLFSFMPTKDERFILPGMTLFLLIAGGTPSVLSRPLRSRPLPRAVCTTAVYALLFVCIGTMAPESLRSTPRAQHQILPRPDRVLLDWIEANVRPGSAVLVESGIVPLIDTLKEPGQFAAALRKSVVASRPNLNQRFIGAIYVGGRNYDPTVVANGAIDYAIISLRNVRYIESRCDAFPEVCSFYAELRARARIVFDTSPAGLEPVVVYQVRRA